jgi:hypothetical protein
MDYFDFTVNYSDNAVITQDIATTLSVAGGTAEIVSTLAGCVGGIETGVAPGCAAGYAAGRAFHTAITNPLEQKFSFISLAATIKANGNWTSESSITALATWGAGQASSEGIVDAAIDLYASGYNHGWFCGINSFPSCFP